jgi:hypothetical protein
VALAATAFAVVSALTAAAVTASRRAPRFPAGPDHWIGAPATWETLRGRVVLLDVWTFG